MTLNNASSFKHRISGNHMWASWKRQGSNAMWDLCLFPFKSNTTFIYLNANFWYQDGCNSYMIYFFTLQPCRFSSFHKLVLKDESVPMYVESSEKTANTSHVFTQAYISSSNLPVFPFRRAITTLHPTPPGVKYDLTSSCLACLPLILECHPLCSIKAFVLKGLSTQLLEILRTFGSWNWHHALFFYGTSIATVSARITYLRILTPKLKYTVWAISEPWSKVLSRNRNATPLCIRLLIAISRRYSTARKSNMAEFRSERITVCEFSVNSLSWHSRSTFSIVLPSFLCRSTLQSAIIVTVVDFQVDRTTIPCRPLLFLSKHYIVHGSGQSQFEIHIKKPRSAPLQLVHCAHCVRAHT